MLNNLKILAVIPARSGSKRVKNKNIKIVHGKPLIYYSIAHAKKIKIIDKIIVSTDSPKYKKIAENYGAEVPVLRPKIISKDKSSDIDLFIHLLKWLEKNTSFSPDICIHFRPTTPIRNVKESINAIKLLAKNKNFDSLRSITKLESFDPYKTYKILKDNSIETIIKDYRIENEDYFKNKQSFYNNSFFVHNGNIDVIWKNTIIKQKSISGKKILGFITKAPLIDINYNSDFRRINRGFIY